LKQFDRFRNPELVTGLAGRINEELKGGRLRFMEVCGTHTMAVFRHGLGELLERSIDLVSGPGCPVCVTPNDYLDTAVGMARTHDVVIATFGDMMRVPGSNTNLERERAAGMDVRVVYSPLDALSIAERETGRKVVFLGVGFETTAPLVASSMIEARKRKLSNFHVLSAHKRIPPALAALAHDPDIEIDGFICPGHVSVIIGSKAYEEIPEKYGIPCVVTGFEPVDIVSGIYMLTRQCLEGRAEVETAYTRAVRPEGNRLALGLLEEVFEVEDAEWRGLGKIPGSGYAISERYSDLDASVAYPVDVEPPRENPACMCGGILKGKAKPPECPLFASACTPSSPVGPCMVSSEGTCAAYYRYGRNGG